MIVHDVSTNELRVGDVLMYVDPAGRLRQSAWNVTKIGRTYVHFTSYHPAASAHGRTPFARERLDNDRTWSIER
jgi:hypothetical protein